MRIVFMGTPDFGVPTLKKIANDNQEVVAVVTQPDKPRGRGHKHIFSPIKKVALELDLPVLQPENINTPEFVKVINSYKPQVIIVAAFGQILKPEVLKIPALGCLNLHASLLPKYRGAAPIQWAMARGETITGVTIQKMVEKLDAGNILVQKQEEIKLSDTAVDLFERLSCLGSEAVKEALNSLPNEGVAQDEELATLAPKLTKEDGLIDWNLTGVEIYNRVRAFKPWPGTYTWLADKKLKVITTELSDTKLLEESKPGTILEMTKAGAWLVSTGKNTTLKILEIQQENTKVMSPQAFVCGYRVSENLVLSSREE